MGQIKIPREEDIALPRWQIMDVCGSLSTCASVRDVDEDDFWYTEGRGCSYGLYE